MASRLGMSVLGRLSLGAKLVLGVLVAVAIGLAGVTWLIASRSQAETEAIALQLGREMAARIGAEVDGKLEVGVDAASMTSNTLTALQEGGVIDRAVYKRLLASVVA